MATMTSLHLNWGWVNTLVSVTAIAIGLSQLIQVLIPRAYAALEKLEQQVEDRTAELMIANAKLQQEITDNC